MKRLFKTKKRVALLVSIAALAAAAGAYAYFTSTGSGSGTGSTATPAALTISEVGAGYDSLIPGSGTTPNAAGNYGEDQTYSGAGITEFGDNVTLANSAADPYQQLVSVTVAFRNWGPAISDLPITISIDNGVAGPISLTESQSFQAALTDGSNPSTTNAVFSFVSQGYPFVSSQFTYGISFDSSIAGGLDVALSDSDYDVSIGTDTVPGTVDVATTSDLATTGDFPTCTGAGSATFGAVNVDCGASVEAGAYGNTGEARVSGAVAGGPTDNADVPAVEFNVVGGVPADLSPGVTEPVDFAIDNPGSAAVEVGSVITTITGATGGCTDTWYTLTPGTPSTLTDSTTVNTLVPTGTTVWSPSGQNIQMTDTGTDQDACIGQSVDLSFSSN